ncbi:MAG: single-stranded-DNA-specific exonuclease RecJ [Flavobacteriales bacterium]|nr:single-stranded-DNA-specific exonuclease RecJ [Flavobacteriales bacterium]
MAKNWKIKETDNKTVNDLADSLGVSRSIAHLLVLRGVTTFDEAKQFFRPDFSQLHNPFLMKDMQKAVDRIQIAIANNEKILVYGDYDVDGTTSVAMLYTFLSTLTENIDYYIPCRYKEGYGISLQGIDYAKENNFSLIIALDCGIRAVNQVEYANEKGVEFIICDHHNPAEEIPNAVAILNPKQKDCDYPFKELSGCGVGFKLIQGFSEKNQIEFENIKPLFDLLVVSIAADIVPMIDENRALSFFGLAQINETPRVGLKALMDVANRKGKWTISDIVFGIAPRINAAGRIEQGKKAVALLIETDSFKAAKLAQEIEVLNKTRRGLDQDITKQALSMIDDSKKSTVVYSQDWHKGVVGIAASRLIETYYKPTVVLAEKDGLLTGSARSVKGFDLYNAILSCEKYLEKFGGHMYAAGLTLKKENLQNFIEAFEVAVSNTITKEQLTPEVSIDMELDLHDIDNKFFRIIQQFAPFGPQNRTPIFTTKAVKDSGYGGVVGEDKSHLRLNITNENIRNSISSIGFGLAHHFEKTKDEQIFDICYSIDENHWNGRKNLQLKLRDIKSD